MNKILAMSITGALLFAPAYTALAQAPAEQPVEAPATPEGASATEGGEIVENYGTVIDAIKQMDPAADLSALSQGELTIILLSSLEGDDNHDGAEVDAAIADNPAGITALRLAVAGNEALLARLQDAGLAAENAIAIGQDANGAWRVYVDDRQG